MNLKKTYNKIAKDWVKDHSLDTYWIEGTEKYSTFLKPGSSILDVGCGAGHNSKYLAEKGFEITGIDFSEKMIEIARIQVPTGNFSVVDIRKPLALDKKFDGVFAKAVLLHIPKNQLNDVLKNITKQLKPGGYFYIMVKEIKPGQGDEEVKKESDYGYEYERFFSYFTLPELKGSVARAGLQIVYEDTIPAGKTNWIQVIAQKPVLN